MIEKSNNILQQVMKKMRRVEEKVGRPIILSHLQVNSLII